MKEINKSQCGGGYYLPNPNGIKGKEKVKLPWKITMEDYVTIDERCYLQGEITFRQHAAIGNNVHIITEGHNVRSRYFEGTNNGIIVGEKNKQLEVAKLMLNNNESLDKISKYTGLTISELEELSNN